MSRARDSFSERHRRFLGAGFGAAALVVGFCASTGRAQSFTQGYESVCSGAFSNCPSLTGAGWVLNSSTNLSDAPGQTGWFQGIAQDPPLFGAQSGPANSYIAANFANTGDNPGAMDTISNWMFAPARVFHNGDTISFWTRTRSFPSNPDRLQLRISLAGTGTDVGTTETSVGTYTLLAHDINPSYLLSGPGSYPTGWTQFVYNISGLANPTIGRFAFRYFVENVAVEFNGDFIGIDNVQYTQVPEPSILALLVFPALLIRRRRR